MSSKEVNHENLVQNSIPQEGDCFQLSSVRTVCIGLLILIKPMKTSDMLLECWCFKEHSHSDLIIPFLKVTLPGRCMMVLAFLLT